MIPDDNMDANLVAIEWTTSKKREKYERCHGEEAVFVVEEQGIGGYFHSGALPVFDVPYDSSSPRFSVGDRVVINPDYTIQMKEAEQEALREVKLHIVFLL